MSSVCARWSLIRDTAIVGLVGATFLSGCGGPSEPTSAQSQTAEQAQNSAEDKAWTAASRTGDAAAIAAYLQQYGSGTHAAEARQLLSALEEKARKEQKAWADAFRAGTAAAMNEYLQHHGSGAHAPEARQRLAVLERLELWNQEEKAWADASRARTAAALSEFLRLYGSGAHAAEARQRLAVLEREARWHEEENARAEASRAETAAVAPKDPPQDQGSGAPPAQPSRRPAALEEQPRRTVETPRKASAPPAGMPAINIRKTCQISADALGRSRDQTIADACIKSEQGARDAIVKQWREFLTVERTLCVNSNVYMPSYVEWLTCLEMQRDVRKLKR
jgi:hypothetical protein